MDIKLSILEKRVKGEYVKPLQFEYHGNFALELMIEKLTEKYFGKEISIKIINILTGRSED